MDAIRRRVFGKYIELLDEYATQTSLSRSQLLVLNFDHVVKEALASVPQITGHFGLPVLSHISKLPEETLQAQLDRNVVQVVKGANGARQRIPLCATREVINLAGRIGVGFARIGCAMARYSSKLKLEDSSDWLYEDEL